jgi:hypothetical protein
MKKLKQLKKLQQEIRHEKAIEAHFQSLRILKKGVAPAMLDLKTTNLL